MNRSALNTLIAWKEAGNRKPLIIRGARQVGKTWLMTTFGKEYYEQTAYLNFESNPVLKNLFGGGFDADKILTGMEIATGLSIGSGNTLLVLDEIQEAPAAVIALKYFQENLPQYHIICAGSLLGVALHQNSSFPVGKVSFMDLQPLSFPEFLVAVGESRLSELLSKQDWSLSRSFSDRFGYLLRLYYFIGGMPEAVATYAQTKNLSEVRRVQTNILAAYEQDFSKHAPPHTVPRIRMLWNSIPSQLAKENKKFIYGIIRTGARAKDYEIALGWLRDCGLIYQVYQVSKPAFPLKAYEKPNYFKIFMVDVGLLTAMASIDEKVLLEGHRIFTEFKGALTEQFALQQLKSLPDLPVYYWSAENTRAEVDFVIQAASQIIPVEVKAEKNLQAKSLKVYRDKFHPQICIRSSMADYGNEGGITDIPLYALPYFVSEIKQPTNPPQTTNHKPETH